MKLSFKGKSAIITGASGGMGLEISKKLSENNTNQSSEKIEKNIGPRDQAPHGPQEPIRGVRVAEPPAGHRNKIDVAIWLRLG